APQGSARAETFITIDNVRVSNASAIEWRDSKARNPHTFNVIGVRRLAAGRHRVVLHASVEGASVTIGRGANLSVLASSATSIAMARLRRDSDTLDLDTRDTPEKTPLPRRGVRTVLSTVPGTARGPIVAMASGSSRENTGPGDAMWGLYLDGREPGIRAMTWSINDLWAGAETLAPMFSQALFVAAPPRAGVQLVATESPYYQPAMASTNGVRFRVAADTMLIALRGGMTVQGAAYSPTFDYAGRGRLLRYAYICIGSNGFKPSCPRSGSDVVVADGEVCIPKGHNGVVMFAAKSRVQGDDHDAGGTVTLRIRIDGKEVGSTGLQRLGPHPHVVSTRTTGASYLAAGRQALKPGCHSVQTVGRATGDFRNLAMNADLPLLWFD
ncbi:MAG: hypothetical protein ACREO8_00890, partial [Luteimonas sp.]